MLNDLTRLLRELKIVFHLLPWTAFLFWIFNGFRCVPILLKTRSVGILDQMFGTSFKIQWNRQILHFEQLDFGVVREIYGHLCYAKQGELKEAHHILDLGANSGAFTVFAAIEAPDARIEAVEIQSHLVQAIQHNVIQNRCEDRVSVRCAVVGGSHNQWTKSVLKDHPEIKKFDIEEYIAQVEVCDFLKCDVEGGEFLLFEGRLNWTKAVQKMALEFHPQEGDVNRLEETLKRQGFDVTRIDHSALGYFYCTRT